MSIYESHFYRKSIYFTFESVAIENIKILDEIKINIDNLKKEKKFVTIRKKLSSAIINKGKNKKNGRL